MLKIELYSAFFFLWETLFFKNKNYMKNFNIKNKDTVDDASHCR